MERKRESPLLLVLYYNCIQTILLIPSSKFKDLCDIKIIRHIEVKVDFNLNDEYLINNDIF